MPIPQIKDYLTGSKASEQKVTSESLERADTSDPERSIISIVTVVYNAEKTLEQTIESVISQTDRHIEYIVIDGGSTDSTISIIKKYEKYISYWCSEPDRGVYDAMNKGIALCKSRLVGILNAGDIYPKEAIDKILSIHLQHPSSIITGNCQVITNSSQWVIESGNFQNLAYRMIPHSSVFVPLSVYKEHGIFDMENFAIAADYDFLCRCYCREVPFIYIEEILSIASPRGVSGNYYLAEAEFTKVRLRHKLFSLPYCLLLTSRSFLSITIHKVLEFLGLWHLIQAQRHASIR